jgi:transcriptional regulator with XRE-family HTH domain
MVPATRTTPQGFGEALKGTRAAAGIALETIADRTKISRRVLSALEEGDFRKLPSRVFARMFLRQYLELVGAQPDEWVRDFEAAWQRHEESRRPGPIGPAIPIRQRRVGPWAVGLALVAVGVVGVLLVEKKPNDGESVAPGHTRLPMAVVPAPTAVPSPAPVATTPPAPPTGALVVRTADAPCWVEVHVAGERPISRLLGPGSTWELAAGGKEVELVLGDAGAATIEYMGEVRSPAGAAGAVARIHLAGNPTPGPRR